MALRRVSVAVVAPIPPASETTATRQVTGDFAMLRIATRMSWLRSGTVRIRCRHHIAATFPRAPAPLAPDKIALPNPILQAAYA
jgi:hypothetical protein